MFCVAGIEEYFLLASLVIQISTSSLLKKFGQIYLQVLDHHLSIPHSR